MFLPLYIMKNLQIETNVIDAAYKNQVQKLLKEGIPYEEMAVLYRTNSGARFLVETLMRYQIPFCMRDTLPNLYEHWIAQDVISYIHIAMGIVPTAIFQGTLWMRHRFLLRDCAGSMRKKTGCVTGLINSKKI